MNKQSKIFVAGHRGLAGSAIVKKLSKKGYTNIIVRNHADLDLCCQNETERFFVQEKPDYVFLAAGKVGGILANNTYKAEFIYDNIAIASNVIHASYKYGVKKLLNLGSSCIYPKFAPQPMKEDSLLTGELEPTNEPYAIAKIAAIKLCRYYNEQYGTNFISVMPTNLYGPNDNFDLENSHVLPALIRKMHLAKLLSQGSLDLIIKDFQAYGNSSITINNKTYIIDNECSEQALLEVLEFFGINKSTNDNPVTLTLWGTGTPFREFLFVDDLAGAVIFLMENYDYNNIGEFVNIGTGKDQTIAELADMVKDIVGFTGVLQFDASKPDGTPKKLLDVSRLNKLQWEHSVELKEGIKTVYQWYVHIPAQTCH